MTKLEVPVALLADILRELELEILTVSLPAALILSLADACDEVDNYRLGYMTHELRLVVDDAMEGEDDARSDS